MALFGISLAAERAVPAVILIGQHVQQGRVVRLYRHDGRPELEADVRMLLSAPSRRTR